MGYLSYILNLKITDILKRIRNRLRYSYLDKRFRPYILRKKIEGMEFDFFIGNTEGRDWWGGPEDSFCPEIKFIRDKLVEKGDIVFDCGGHHGYITILLSKWVGEDGRVMTFEPIPKNIEIIKKNVNLNGLSNVVIEDKALGSFKGKVTVSSSSNANVLPKSIFRFIYGGLKSDMVPLDEYIDLKPSFLKIDVEGYEAEVLKGAKSILKKLPKLAIEIHTEQLCKYDTSVREVLNVIGVERYDCWVQWDDREEPVEFDINRAITKRIHLFAIPKKKDYFKS